LPLTDLTAQCEILLPGRTEFEQNCVGQTPNLVKVCATLGGFESGPSSASRLRIIASFTRMLKMFGESISCPKAAR